MKKGQTFKNLNTCKPLIGAHMSIAGGVHTAIQRGMSIGCKTIQIFTKNNTQWNCSPLTYEEIVKFKKLAKKTKISPIIAHSAYLINLSAQDEKMLIRSHYSLIDELKRCELLGIKCLIIHPGYHGGIGISEGIKRVAESIDSAYEKFEEINVSIALETTAGQGTSIGYRFEHIREIIDKTFFSQKILTCIDTAHIFEAGYDITSEEKYRKTIDEFDSIVGLNRLAVIHINDSKTPLNSRIDRHEHIGKGMIGTEAFSFIMNDRRLFNIPKILETPKGQDLKEDIENLNTLKNLYQLVFTS